VLEVFAILLRLLCPQTFVFWASSLNSQRDRFLRGLASMLSLFKVLDRPFYRFASCICMPPFSWASLPLNLPQGLSVHGCRWRVSPQRDNRSFFRKYKLFIISYHITSEIIVRPLLRAGAAPRFFKVGRQILRAERSENFFDPHFLASGGTKYCLDR